MLQKIVFHFTKYLKSFIFNIFKRKFDKSNQIYVFTDGRGGGTWLMEMLANATESMTIFEPFSENNFGYSKRFQHYSYPFCASNDNEISVLKSFLIDVEQMRKPGQRALMFNSFKQILFAKNAVYKFVNKNLILQDFFYILQPKNKVILLLRNPVDIIKSRKNYGFKNLENVGNFDWKENWKIDGMHPLMNHIPFLNTLKNAEELYVAEWCASVSEVLNNDNLKDKIIVVNYEDLKANPIHTIEDILQELNLTFDLSKLNTNKKSFSTNRMTSFFVNVDKSLHTNDFNFIFKYFSINFPY